MKFISKFIFVGVMLILLPLQVMAAAATSSAVWVPFENDHLMYGETFSYNKNSIVAVPANTAPRDIKYMSVQFKEVLKPSSFTSEEACTVISTVTIGLQSDDWTYTNIENYNINGKLIEKIKPEEKWEGIHDETVIAYLYNVVRKRADELKSFAVSNPLPPAWLPLSVPDSPEMIFTYNDNSFLPEFPGKVQQDEKYVSMMVEVKEEMKDGTKIKLIPGGYKRDDVYSVISTYQFELPNDRIYTCKSIALYDAKGKLVQKHAISEKFFSVMPNTFMNFLYDKALEKANARGYIKVAG